MLNVVMLSVIVIMLSVIMLSDFMLSVVMLSVVAPTKQFINKNNESTWSEEKHFFQFKIKMLHK